MAGKISGLDARYSINLEWTGDIIPLYVVRFCGDFVGSHEDIYMAQKIGIEHNLERLGVDYVAN